MSFASRFNKGNNVFDIDTTGFNYWTCEEFYKRENNNVIPVDGLYINSKARYPHAVAISKEYGALIDLPSYMNDTVRDILADAESINLIKKGCVGMKVRQYHSEQYAKDCYGVDWVDL